MIDVIDHDFSGAIGWHDPAHALAAISRLARQGHDMVAAKEAAGRSEGISVKKKDSSSGSDGSAS